MNETVVQLNIHFTYNSKVISLISLRQWPYSHYRRIIRWIIRVRQIKSLNLKIKRSLVWMDNPPDFSHLFSVIF